MYTSEYPIINVTVDVVVTHHDADGYLWVLVIKRKNEPFKGMYALPGGFLNPDEDGVTAALRELDEETGIYTDHFIAPLPPKTLPGRDPRGPVVSLPYLFTVNEKYTPKAGDDAASAEWVSMWDLITEDSHPLAFDHKQILQNAMRFL